MGAQMFSHLVKALLRDWQLFAAHALCSKRRRPDGGGSVYAMHRCVAHTLQEFSGHAGVASFAGGGMCRAGTGPDGHPVHADIAFTGLATGAIDGDRKLVDVTVRNFVGGKLNIMHHSRTIAHIIKITRLQKKKEFAPQVLPGISNTSNF